MSALDALSKPRVLHRGYWDVCENCLRMVVHARSTRRPFHMHRWSKRCRDDGEEIRRIEAVHRVGEAKDGGR